MSEPDWELLHKGVLAQLGRSGRLLFWERVITFVLLLSVVIGIVVITLIKKPISVDVSFGPIEQGIQGTAEIRPTADSFWFIALHFFAPVMMIVLAVIIYLRDRWARRRHAEVEDRILGFRILTMRLQHFPKEETKFILSEIDRAAAGFLDRRWMGE